MDFGDSDFGWKREILKKAPCGALLFFHLVTPAGFEPAIAWMRTKSPGPLDDGATTSILAYFLPVDKGGVGGGKAGEDALAAEHLHSEVEGGAKGGIREGETDKAE